MSDPVLYYVEETTTRGRIVAIAPDALRDEDRMPDWIPMRISEEQWKPFADGQTSTADWFVDLNPKTQVHTLKSVAKKTTVRYQNIVSLIEARSEVKDPDLIIEAREDGIWVRISDSVHRGYRRGQADFWLTQEQNHLVVLAHTRIDLATDNEARLFDLPKIPTSIYSNSPLHRIQDVRR